MRTHIVLTTLTALLLGVGALPATAQDAGSLSIEAQTGYAGFLDDATIDHGFVGGALKTRLTRRLWIGPEIVWMRGPDHDRDLFLTGTLTWDLVSPPEARRDGSSARHGLRLVPFLVAGGGVMRHEDRFVSGTFASWEGAVTGGGGARIQVGRRWYVAPEFRVGWEPHYRIGVSIGMDVSKD
jgi:hypothetical protein